MHDAIDKTVLLILCASLGPLFDKIAFNIAEVTARGSLVMLISDLQKHRESGRQRGTGARALDTGQQRYRPSWRPSSPLNPPCPPQGIGRRPRHRRVEIC